MSNEFSTDFYVTTNERGEVILTTPEEAQAIVTVYVSGKEILGASLELVEDRLTEEEEEEILDNYDEDRQMDLFERFSNPKFGRVTMEDPD